MSGHVETDRKSIMITGLALRSSLRFYASEVSKVW
ncbi:hypothetical protein SLEP1_g31550 [Rubroshorea leprosula]|uniref:Uncharacterized protein n=1 Tax=Rubroshorea leprosula TaxID=152421 RepID=A0AAV5K3N9_9ROSI|nr:hypothetical protein SLEP1_g31550 [Rubroshorea leprosula]